MQTRDVVREYMAARTVSFKPETILEAWRRVGSGQSIQQFSLRPISRRVTQRLHTPTSHCPFLLGCPPCLTHHPTISSTQPHLTTPRMMKTDKKMDKLRNQNRRSPHLPRRRHHRRLPWKELTDELVQSNTSSLRPCRCPTTNFVSMLPEPDDRTEETRIQRDAAETHRGPHPSPICCSSASAELQVGPKENRAARLTRHLAS